VTKRARRKAPSKVPLSHETIRGAALALIDRAGLAAFSTRKLGAELGCEAMAIYWYYPNKDALLDAVVDELMAGVAAVADRDTTDWVGSLRELAHAYRRIAHEHPEAFPLLATRRFATPRTFAFMERLFAEARRNGLDDRTTARLYRVVSSYCSGFALNELATPRTTRGTAVWRRQFPRVAAVSAWLEREHLDELFEFGLELQLESLSRRKKARAR
jgi:AcrR family transcriptional regulator